MESYTYSNTICPKCHSTEVVWNFNSMKDPALECMKCHHKFDPPIYQPTSKYKIITLCGSTRFRDTFLWIQKELTLAGYIVISVGCFGHYENESEQKRIEEKKTIVEDLKVISLGFDKTSAEPFSCNSFNVALNGVFLTQSLNSISDG